MIDFLNSEILSLESLIINAITILGMAMVGMVYARTKAAAPTIGALILAGTVIWGVRNVNWFERQIEKETNKAGLAPAHLIVIDRG